MPRLDYKNATAFIRNDFVPFKDANLSIASSPVLYGLSFYTVFSVNWNAKDKKLYAFRVADHYKRLVNSAKIMDFDSFAKDWPHARFEKTMIELVRRNKIQEDALVRITVFIDEIVAGTKIHGLKNSLSAFIYPMGEILPKSGAHLCVSSWLHTPDNVIPPRAKVNGLYANNSLMKNEALLNGYDDAIALDISGHVNEGTVANLFIVRDGKLITPDPSTDILEGITRNSVLAIAKDQGIKCVQRSVDRSELYIADEMFLCGSSAKISPVISVDKHSIGNGKIGPITKKLADVYEAVQRGTVTKYSSWRTTV
jgi:branched-chain amino acid aminotransferase